MTVDFGMELEEDSKSIGMDPPQISAIPTTATVEEAGAVCFGCGAAIYDPFIMHVQPDLKWHGRCLKCYKCERGLSDETSCFVRNGKAYCREDYCNSSFLQRCAGCQQPITKVDLVIRIRNQTFHMGCFRCVVCSAILQPGEEIAYRRDMPYCLRDAKLTMPEKWDFPPPTVSNATTLMEGDAAEPKVLTLLSPVISSSTSKPNEDQQQQLTLKLVDGGEPATYLSPQPPHRTRSDSTSSSLDGPMGENDLPMTPNSEGSQDEDDCSSLFGCMTSAAVSCLSGDTSSQQQTTPALNGETPPIQPAANSAVGHNHLTRSGSGGGGKNGGKRSKEQKTTRVRTVLNEKQLHMLRTCYAANPRPDALMKEQLVEMTGLSPRVIRVWFQNKRCKDKKKQIMIKQMEQHHQNGLHPCGLQGVPMVAGSPLPNDSSMLCSSSGIEVQRISSDKGGAGSAGGAGGMCSPVRPDVSTPPPPSQPRFSPAYPLPPPPSHLFNGMLPPISHVDVKPPLPHSSSSSSSSAHLMLSPSMGLPAGDEGPFPPFQQLVSTFDLVDPLQRGQPGHEDGLTSGSRLSYGVPGGSGSLSNGPPAPTAVVDGPPFVFPIGDPTFTTLRPISLRPPSLST
ncbi:insulin locus tag enhancer protein ISL 2 [Echinococcus multilocularis]|uniref:Insulin locus tag enhancer protein ISL 2 n=1 Tax=Echinococcus multilocularis TaxID=6211 RepID=A0A068YC98_ECHMU|nr:insulin locus tag enhancer protein ISL 2 [Echinococcus multilocularis]